MAGRAGRRGIDTEGFCYVLSCNDEQSKFYKSLIKFKKIKILSIVTNNIQKTETNK